MSNVQVHFEIKRERSQRCPKCGSPRLSATYDDLDDTEEYECPDCRWFKPAYLSDEGRDAPFIMPGDPGSRDTAEDYT